MVGLSRGYDPHKLTDRDLELSLICWGFTLGFGVLTACKAWEQTVRVKKGYRIKSLYIWLLWVDIFSSYGFAIGVWFYVRNYVKDGFPIFFIIIFSWAVQIQSQLQIIINRLRLIMSDRRRATQLRWCVFAIILAVNITVGCIWIPTAMQIYPNQKINKIWDRTQKVIYLIVDGSLNYYFVRLVNKELIAFGLQKYKALADFNTRIVILSVAMDIMIIGLTFYPNPYVFMAFQPPVFLAKVCIEMNMADLILKITKSKENSDLNLDQLHELSCYQPGRESSDNWDTNLASTSSKFPVVRSQGSGVEAGSQTSFNAIGGEVMVSGNDEHSLQLSRTRQSAVDSSGMV